jgi:hypothetical protein
LLLTADLPTAQTTLTQLSSGSGFSLLLMESLAMSDDTTDPSPSQFEVKAYVPDGGGGSLGGTLQLVSILSSIGTVIGLAVSFMSQWFYLIVVFPMIMGALVGLVGAMTIKRYRIRRPFLCGLAGFVAGCFCFLAMHYCNHLRFERRLSDVPVAVREIARSFDQLITEVDRLPDDVRQIVTQLRAAPETLRALRVSSFLDFMNLQAETGVTIAGRGGRANGTNLGYAGSIIYWIAESLFLAVVATAIMTSAAATPYCAQCHSWKVESPTLINSSINPDLISNKLLSGDLAAFEQFLMETDPVYRVKGQYTKVKTHACPLCQSDAPFEVAVIKVKTNSKNGEEGESNLGLITFPGEALFPFMEIVSRRRPLPHAPQFG